jgi:hypothetical protein
MAQDSKAKVCELILAMLRANHGTETGNAQHSDEGVLDELDSSTTESGNPVPG